MVVMPSREMAPEVVLAISMEPLKVEQPESADASPEFWMVVVSPLLPHWAAKCGQSHHHPHKHAFKHCR